LNKAVATLDNQRMKNDDLSIGKNYLQEELNETDIVRNELEGSLNELRATVKDQKKEVCY
jgi:hypothetical protein